MCRITLAGGADGADRAEEFADPEGRAVPLPPADGRADAGLALAESAAPDAAGPELAAAEPAVLELAPLELPVLELPVLELAVLELAVLELAVLELAAAEPCGLDGATDAAVAEGRLGFPVPLSGLNVATDSMALATRQTARMLASSGITVPCPPNGPVSLRSRRRRRSARSSRWYAITSRSSSRASSGIWMSSGGSSQPGFTRHLRP